MEARKIIPIEVKDEYVIGAGRSIGAVGSHDDVALRVTFNDMWDGTAKTAVWLNALGQEAVVQMLLPKDADGYDTSVYIVPIPEEAKSEIGNAMLTIKGFTPADGVTEATATLTATAYFHVLESDFDDDASASGSISLTQSEQFQAQLNAMAEDIVNAAKAADAAERAERAAEDAEESMETADQAAIGAEGYRDEARAAVVKAEAAQIAADRARANAEEAMETADQAALNAKGYRDEARSAQIAAERARDAAEGFQLGVADDAAAAARSAAEAARSAAEAAVSTAKAGEYSSDAKDFSEAASDSANAASAAALRAEDAADKTADGLDKKLDKAGGTMTGDLNVYSADVNVTNGSVSVSSLFWHSASLNATGVVLDGDGCKATLSLDGLFFEDAAGNKKSVGGIGYALAPDQAVPFGQMEEYVLEAVPSIKTDETLSYEDGVLSVNTADKVEDNTLPITAAAVNTTVGNIEVLLGQI